MLYAVSLTLLPTVLFRHARRREHDSGDLLAGVAPPPSYQAREGDRQSLQIDVRLAPRFRSALDDKDAGGLVAAVRAPFQGANLLPIRCIFKSGLRYAL